MKDFFETGLETTAPVADHRTPRRLALLDDIDRALGHAVGLVGTARHERGKVRLAVGTLVRASGVRAEVGEICRLVDPGGGGEQRAEVIGFDGDEVLMSPMGGLDGLSGSTQVIATGQRHAVAVGDFLLGRVVDGLGERFLDQGPPAPGDAMRLSVSTGAPPPLTRRPIEHALPSGVNAIDGVLTCGVGQRMGIFAPAGCGKSTLLSMLCRNAEVDVVVAALVGERGREVQDFIDDALGPAAMQRAVLVVATSDRPATERLKAAYVATSYAEHFASRGQRVLLLVDSVTRLARAAREIGLAAGEPPARRGFPPSVFAALPLLFERAGNLARGSITAFYTVLEESDDGMDPVSEEVRSLLDGHVVLSRKLAGKGHYPAIDVLQSTSRLFDRLVDEAHAAAARRLRELLAKYDEVELLLRIGEFQRGADTEADFAVERRSDIDRFLRQPRTSVDDFATTVSALKAVVS
ncbi:MAG: synthase [Pseudomonadota bacterium]|jgi:type III secretion protein N (ATPase)